MKVRELLEHNLNNVASITICDGGDFFTCLSRNSLSLERFMHREVFGWTADGTVNMCLPGMTIILEKEAEHGR